MAEFDPAVIADIPDLASPNRAAKQRLTIADMVDQGQMSKLKLSAERTKQSDAAKAKEVLKGADYSTPEGVTKTAESLTRAGLPDQAMDFMQAMQKLQSGKGELDQQQYEMAAIQNNMIGSAAAQLSGEYDAAIQKGVPPQQAAAMMQPKYQQAIQQLMQAKLPNGKPALNPHALDQIQQNPQFNPEFVRGVAQTSKQGAEALKAQLAYHTSERQDKAETEKERHNKAMEGAKSSGFSGRSGELMAALAERGVALPSGMRSKQQQQATLEGLLARNPNISTDEIADKIKGGQISFGASKTEANVVARREGSSAAAISALNSEGGLYDQLQETARKVDFGSAKFNNALRLWKQGEVVADPDISEYVNALADTRAEFASVLARGGQVTDSVRIASEHAFPDKMSLEELNRNVARSKKIARSIQAGNTAVADAIVKGKDLNEALDETSKEQPKTAPTGGFDDPEKEARYQAWKKSHGG